MSTKTAMIELPGSTQIQSQLDTHKQDTTTVDLILGSDNFLAFKKINIMNKMALVKLLTLKCTLTKFHVDLNKINT